MNYFNIIEVSFSVLYNTRFYISIAGSSIISNKLSALFCPEHLFQMVLLKKVDLFHIVFVARIACSLLSV